MVYSAINEKGEAHFTFLKKIFDAIGNRQTEYNWLITDCFCCPQDPEASAMLQREYCWLSGKELTALVQNEDFLWIWAVLSAFEKSVALSEILQYDLPYADGYPGFWKTPLTMQHPLARKEIVPWDSTLTLIFSSRKEIVDGFRKTFPESEDLEDYIEKNGL